MTIALAAALSLQLAAPHDWNDSAISWQPYEAGLAAARKANKPVCLVFYTTWCPHCSNYARVFHDAKVVELSKKFVMIRLDKDKNRPVSAKYNPDGEYIPRTYFLSSAGVIEKDIHARRDQYKYFYDENDARSVLAGMKAALAKLAP